MAVQSPARATDSIRSGLSRTSALPLLWGHAVVKILHAIVEVVDVTFLLSSLSPFVFLLRVCVWLSRLTLSLCLRLLFFVGRLSGCLDGCSQLVWSTSRWVAVELFGFFWLRMGLFLPHGTALHCTQRGAKRQTRALAMCTLIRLLAFTRLHAVDTQATDGATIQQPLRSASAWPRRVVDRCALQNRSDSMAEQRDALLLRAYT